MLKRKWLALLLVLMLGIGTLTGCSPTEQSYYNVLMEASTQKVYTESGSMELNVAQLPASMFTGEAALNEEVVRKAIDQHRLEYSGKVDVNQNIFQYDFVIVDNITSARSLLTSIIYQNNVIYIKIDDLLKYMQEFSDPAEKQRLDGVFKDVAWISISDQDLIKAMPAGSPSGLTNNLLQKSSRQMTIYKRLYDGLFNEVYKNYSSNLVSKSNNQYIFTLRGAQLIDVIKPVSIHTIYNIDKLGKVLKTFFTGLTPSELADLGFTEQMRKEVLMGVEVMVIEVNWDRDKYLGEIENMCAKAQPELLSVVNDSELVSTLEKTDATTYATSSKLHLNITAGNPVDKINFTLTSKDTVKVGGTVQVAAPTSQVITLTELQNRLPRQIKVNVDTGSYTQTNGIMTSNGNMLVKIEDNRTYLPLNQVATAMGEKVSWDFAAKQAYVIKEGQRINMSGILVNYRTYVKVIDFEKLGYKVDWNESTRMVTIEK